MSEDTVFLNVDLDLFSTHGLDALVDALGTSVVVLNRQVGFVSVGLADVQPETVDAAVECYVGLVLALDSALRAIWDKCSARRFNVGLQAGDGPHQSVFPISEKSIALLASMKAEIAITVYAP